MPRPAEIDDATLRVFELHETRAHALGDRLVRDLGDCVLLHAPTEPDRYVNRVGAIRWPDHPAAFDRRLGEVISVFAGIDRAPHLWTPPAFRSPPDLEDRLRANGFREAGPGAHVMTLVEAPPAVAIPAGVTVELVRASDARAARQPWAHEVTLVLARAFGFTDEELPAVEREVRISATHPGMTTGVVREGGEAVAVGRSFSDQGTSGRIAYLLSIGTDPRVAGRGFGTILTASLAVDAVATGAAKVFLAVRSHNDRAIALYGRCGFARIGDVAGEFVLG